MKSLASLALIFAAPVHAQEPPPGDGPRGSSQAAPGEQRFDAVGYVAVAPRPGVAAAVRGLAPGSFAEVTALASGRTIVVAVEIAIDDSFATLSPLAAEALGIGAGAAVRIRRITPSPQDVAALRAGSMASARMDSPAALLAPLRKRLPPRFAEVPPTLPATRRVKAVQVAKPTPTPEGRYWVQVAALASATNARALAAKLGGIVVADGGLYRIRIGPLPDRAAAEKARARVAQLGYPDAAIQPR